jgi:hypothetical protein
MSDMNAVFLVMLVAGYFAALAYFERSRCKSAFISNDEYLSSLAQVRQCSVYDLFRSSAADWRFSSFKIESDFEGYLKTGHIPQYVVKYAQQNIRPEDVKSLRLISRTW